VECSGVEVEWRGVGWAIEREEQKCKTEKERQRKNLVKI